MVEVSFVETSSVLDETDISMNVSIGGTDGGPDEDKLTQDSPVAESTTWADGGPDENTLIPSSPVAEKSGSKPVQPALPAAETPGHSQHSPFAETSGSSRPKPTQSCEVCSYSTTSRGNMYRHKRSVHSHDKHSCDTCSREYSAKYDLVEHVRTIHRRDLLICELCSKSFNGRKALSLHKAFVHEQREKFKCQSCSQTFHSRAHYHGHINTHANSKPYTCVVCS